MVLDCINPFSVNRVSGAMVNLSYGLPLVWAVRHFPWQAGPVFLWLGFTAFQIPEFLVGKIPGASQEPQPTASTKSGRLKILTQNVWAHYFATPLGLIKPPEGVAAPAMLGMRYSARLSILAARIAEGKYDVVCVQELFLLRVGPFVYTSNFRLFAEHMAKAGYIYHTDPTESLPSHFGQNSGVCIFSKTPLTRMEAEVYHASDEKALNSKGFVCASVIVESLSRSPVEVRVLSVHTDSRHWPSKILQLEQIKTKIASVKTSSQRAKRSVEFVIAGDFNVCPQRVGEGGYDDGGQYKLMAQQMKAAADLEDAWDEEESVPTQGEASLDHIFIEPAKWKVVSDLPY